MLIVDELGGGEVTGAAELPGLDDFGFGAKNRLREDYFGDQLGAGAANDFHAEGEHVVAVVDDGGAIDSRESGDDIHGPAQVQVARLGIANEGAERGERRNEVIGDGTDYGIPPSVGAGGHDQERAAA